MRRRMTLVLALTWALAACNGSESEPRQQQSPATTAPATTDASGTPTPTPADTADAQACSANDLPPEPEVQPDLPEPVQETRRQIYVAAVRCDFDRLEELAPEEGFTYSFGGGDDPAGFWRAAEFRDDGNAPMQYLAGMLQRPYGTRQVQGATHYAWPSAFTYDSWSDVPERDREALKPLYGEERFEGFERFGAYVGYRVVIDADGTWRAFVAGD